MKFTAMMALVNAALASLAAPFKGLPAIGAPLLRALPQFRGSSAPRTKLSLRREQQKTMYGKQPCARAFTQYARRYG